MFAFVLDHWFRYNYAGGAPVWYEHAVWPNVFVIAPVVILSFFYARSKHLAAEAARAELKVAHARHDVHLRKLLDHFDPNTQGGISDVLDRLDMQTPGGIADLRTYIDNLKENEK